MVRLIIIDFVGFVADYDCRDRRFEARGSVFLPCQLWSRRKRIRRRWCDYDCNTAISNFRASIRRSKRINVACVSLPILEILTSAPSSSSYSSRLTPVQPSPYLRLIENWISWQLECGGWRHPILCLGLQRWQRHWWLWRHWQRSSRNICQRTAARSDRCRFPSDCRNPQRPRCESRDVLEFFVCEFDQSIGLVFFWFECFSVLLLQVEGAILSVREPDNISEVFDESSAYSSSPELHRKSSDVREDLSPRFGPRSASASTTTPRRSSGNDVPTLQSRISPRDRNYSVISSSSSSRRTTRTSPLAVQLHMSDIPNPIQPLEPPRVNQISTTPISRRNLAPMAPKLTVSKPFDRQGSFDSNSSVPEVQPETTKLATLYLQTDASRSRRVGDSKLQSEPITIIPHVLFIGGIHQARSLPELQSRGIEFVINATDNLPNYFQNKLTYLNCRIPFTGDGNLSLEFRKAFGFIQKARESGKCCFIYSTTGDSRSVSIVVAYLMLSEQWSLERALAFVEDRLDPMPVIRETFIDSLRKLTLNQSSTDTIQRKSNLAQERVVEDDDEL